MPPVPATQNEAFSRVLIDRALDFSWWNILDPHQVRFELDTGTGRADYVLSGGRGPREHLCSLASGSTHKTIYFPTVKQFSVLVRPLSLQEEFAEQVAEIRALQCTQAASRRRLDDLFRSLLHRAFSGEL